MTALVLAFSVFLAWSAIGLAVLVVARADTSNLRLALTAPALGSSVTVIPAFILSLAGVSMNAIAVPLIVVLLVISALTLALRRPPIPRALASISVLCLGGLVLIGWPAISLGFDWLGNGNADMGDYVLRAVQLMHSSLLAPLNGAGLNRGVDYVTTSVGPNLWGERPGSEVMLALLARFTSRAPHEVYMPLGLATNIVAACSAGALALTATRRRLAAHVAAALVLVSPLFTFGIMQQLLPQQWGLALSVALLALLMRTELHEPPGGRFAELVPVGLLLTGTILVYVEIIPEVAGAYLLYLMLIASRRHVSIRALARLWVSLLVVVLLLLNVYLVREVGFLGDAAQHGAAAEHPPLFGYILVPSALPGVIGLQTLPTAVSAPLLDVSIVVAGILLLVGLAGSLAGLRRPSPPAIAVVVEAALAILLAAKGSDFGLFKLSMYIQPLLAALVAVWVANAKPRSTQILAGAAVGLLVVFQLSTQRAYVRASRDPVDVPEASSAQLVPTFTRTIAADSGPVVSTTENPFLIMVEGAAAYGRKVSFLSRDVFDGFLSIYAAHTSDSRHREVEREKRLASWPVRMFDLKTGAATDEFKESPLASQALNTNGCKLSVSSGRVLIFNRVALPASSPPLVSMPCNGARNLLAFVQSRRGEGFYVPSSQRRVSFWQLQPDPYVSGATMAGLGRYVLFRVLGPTAAMRLEFNLTTTLNHDGAERIPPAAVVGATRAALPLTGNGSARVFSVPVRPQMIAGQPYVLVDMGVDPREPSVPRSGLQALYGGGVPLDTRFLSAYVRDVSLVSARQYKQMRPPMALSRFPSDLANPNLQYSGLYEDGWMGGHGYAVLAGGAAADLIVRGEVPAGAGEHLRVLVNGRPVSSVSVAAGPLNISVPLAASSGSRRIELIFARTIQLRPPDLRPAAAHLSYLGLVPRR